MKINKEIKMTKNPELIQITEDKKPSIVICPKCKQEILIDIMPFSKDVSSIMQDKCPKCGGTIFVGILILCHPSLRGICLCIQTVIDALKPGNLKLPGKNG
jgi:DNA-directed RNA polymerase subunit RPC12/RpoP